MRYKIKDISGVPRNSVRIGIADLVKCAIGHSTFAEK